LAPRALFKSPEGKILLCILAIAPFLLTPWVHGDGIGSLAILRSVVVDRDLDLTNEFRYLTTHIEADAGGLPGALLDKSDHTPGVDPQGHNPAPDRVTGRVPFFSSIGPPIFWAPAYLAAHTAVHLGRGLGLAHRDDGYGGLYYLAIAIVSLVCGIVGLILAYRFARICAPEREATWATLSIACASPLLYYLYLAPSYCHTITTLAAGTFFLYWYKNRGTTETGVWFRWGLLAGLLFIVRWNDIVLAVPIFVAEVIRFLRPAATPGEKRQVRRLLICLAAAFVGFLFVASIQLIVWQYFHGRPLIRYPFGAMGFWTEGLWGTFISSRHGLFIWTPVTILAVIGVFRLFRRNRELATVSITTLALLAASNCTIFDWWGGASFGMRRLVSATPLFVLGLAVFFDDIRLYLTRAARRESRTDTTAVAIRERLVAPVVCFAFSIWNVLLVAQYSLGMISHRDPVTFATIAANQPRVVARMIELLKDLLL
jgi:hypothetical protein